MSKREPLMTATYFDELIEFMQSSIEDLEQQLQHPERYKKPQILAFSLFFERCQILIARYSRGDDLQDLTQAFPPIVEAWEAYLRCEQHQHTDLSRLDDYVRSLWLVSLALVFDVTSGMWERLLRCIGNEGRDRLYERLVAQRTPGRLAATGLLHPQPYAVLDKAVEAAQAEKAEHMAAFLKRWYGDLAQVDWHDNHKGPDGGGFFGYWAIEAAGVAVAFGIDDSSFRDMPYYPKDLADFGRSMPGPGRAPLSTT